MKTKRKREREKCLTVRPIPLLLYDAAMSWGGAAISHEASCIILSDTALGPDLDGEAKSNKKKASWTEVEKWNRREKTGERTEEDKE